MTKRREKKAKAEELKSPISDTDYGGRCDPRNMPRSMFYGSLRRHFATAVRADTSKHHTYFYPRYWYVDADYRCEACLCEFVWTAEEQRVWFEDYQFYIQAEPRLCRKCRVRRRKNIELKKQYDSMVGAARSGDVEAQLEVINIVDLMKESAGKVPELMLHTADGFKKNLDEE